MYKIEDIINKIHCADCLEFMKEIPDGSIDCVITDPPYGINMDKGTFFINNSGKRRGFNSSRNYEKGNWDKNRPTKKYFDEMIRISKNQIIFGGNYFIDYLFPSRCWIFWHKKVNKTQGINFADGELIWTSFDKNTKYIQIGWLGLDQINHKDEISKLHPTQKPVKLMRWIIENYTKENDTIIDPFAGSGSTCVAAQNLHRNFIGIELEPKYCEIARERLKQQTLI